MSDNAPQAHSILANLGMLLPDLESVYKDIHSHPELSMQENRTAGIAANRDTAMYRQSLMAAGG